MESKYQNPKPQDRKFNLLLSNWRWLIRNPNRLEMNIVNQLMLTTRDQKSITTSDVEEFLATVIRQTPRPINFDRTEVTTNGSGPHEGMTIRSVVFDGEKLIVASGYWYDMAALVFGRIAANEPEEFRRVLTEIARIEGKRYFTENKHDFDRSCEIENTGIYFDRNLSANNVVELCNVVARCFGYDDKLQIEHC